MEPAEKTKNPETNPDPDHDGSGNGHEKADNCDSGEHGHIGEEDAPIEFYDAGMGLVNGCIGAPFANELIQRGEAIPSVEAITLNVSDPSVANDVDAASKANERLRTGSMIDFPCNAVASTQVSKDESAPETEIEISTELLSHSNSQQQQQNTDEGRDGSFADAIIEDHVAPLFAADDDGIAVIKVKEMEIEMVGDSVPSYDSSDDTPTYLEKSESLMQKHCPSNTGISGGEQDDVLVVHSDIATDGESVEPLELPVVAGSDKIIISMTTEDNKSSEDQLDAELNQRDEDPPSENAIDTEKSAESDDSNEDDFASGAAATMAAVAAAASANTTSPSAAAEAARAMAPNLVPATISTRKEDITMIRLSAVKAQMSKRMDSVHKSTQYHSDHGLDPLRNIVELRLARSENDAFLQYLLLFQYFRTCDESNDPNEFPSASIEPVFPGTSDVQSSCQNPVLTSSEKVRSMLHMAEEAYDAMEALLPALSSTVDDKCNLNNGGSEDNGVDTIPLVPDLLPPCTSVRGDATLQFFVACRGEENVEHLDISAVDSSSKDGTASELGTVVHSSTNESDDIDPTVAPKSAASAASVFTSMFSSMTRTTKIQPARPSNSTLAGVFRKRSQHSDSILPEKENDLPTKLSCEGDLLPGEYAVSIDREMLGLTVENVLERTIVRTVLPGGAAKKAGAKIGSLIVRVGNVETKNLTHFETIDELRQSQRPLKLVLRQIAVDSLRSAREEMGRLIRGGGFGTSPASDPNDNADLEKRLPASSFTRAHNGKPSKAEAFSQVLHQRWSKDGTLFTNKKEEALVQAGEKLVWILTLLVIGLEREASKAPSLTSRESHPEGSPGKRAYASHMAEDYIESSKSVSKVLWDFVSYKLLASGSSSQVGDSVKAPDDFLLSNPGNRGRRGPPPLPSGRFGARARAQDQVTAKRTKDSHDLLVRIGDVLHRTRTFLADPASPPAALVRGEVISFLCDILDIDTDMVLSEEEGGSSTAGINAAPLNDLGAAGSLLKLIILNCSMMRSPGCPSLKNSNNDVDMEEEQRRRFGSLKKQLSGVDLHRFHAGNRFLAVVHRLAASRSVSARVTACSLGPVLWGHLDFPHQLQVSDPSALVLHLFLIF